MDGIKELKSIELTSYTTIMTGITVLFSVILAIIVTIAMGIGVPNGLGIAIYLIPTIIVGAFMLAIYQYFSEGLFYNLLAKKLRTVAIAIKDEKEIVKISTTETAMMVSLIATIQVILMYLVSVMILPLVVNSTIQTLIYSGKDSIAYTFYQLLMILSQPTTIIMLIFGSFIISFVFILIGCYIYNFIAKKGKGIVLNLREENGFTAIDSINPMRLSIAFAIISGILSLFIAIIMIISGVPIMNAISNVLSSFIAGFIGSYIFAIFYNFLAPKLGKLKIELIDYKIN